MISCCNFSSTFLKIFELKNPLLAEKGEDGQTIDSFGLYKYFTSMGIYLCKPLDYIVQVGSVAPPKDNMGVYYFLGNDYHNLFPVKQILEHR